MSRNHAIIKGIVSPTIGDLVNFRPSNEKSFAIPIQIRVGLDSDHSEESFDIMVCNPDWIREKIEEVGVFDGRHHLLVNRFDFDLIYKFIEEYIAKCSGENWDEISNKISRLGYWEFEDYIPDRY